MAKRVEFTVSDVQWGRLEVERGLVPRAAWVKARLFGDGSGDPASRPAARVLPGLLGEPLTEESVRHLEAGTVPTRSVPAAEASRRYGPKRAVKPIPKGDK